MPGLGKDFTYVADPIAQTRETKGNTQLPDPMKKELQDTEKLNKEMSDIKSGEEKKAEPKGVAQWSTYTDALN